MKRARKEPGSCFYQEHEFRKRLKITKFAIRNNRMYIELAKSWAAYTDAMASVRQTTRKMAM